MMLIKAVGLVDFDNNIFKDFLKTISPSDRVPFHHRGFI